MKFKFVTAYFLLLITVASAQTGNYFLSHYSPDEERFNIVCFDMVQDARGVFYFATQAGILQFDGRNWDIIPTIGTIYSIAINEAGEIYAAGSRGFGRVERNEQGLEVFTMIHEQKDAEYIFQITILPEKVYFLSDQKLYEFSVKSKTLNTIASTAETGLFVSLNEIYNTIFIDTEQKGLFKLDNGKMVSTSIGLGEGHTLILAPKYGNEYLLVTDSNRLFLCSPGFKLKEISLQDYDYVEAGVIVNATWVKHDLIAIGTLRGGVIFIDTKTGKTEEIINYTTGLPDNEVFALLTDRNLNVWAAHAYGFTRVSPYLPFRSYHFYSGLQGNLLCATTYQDKVYAGTSLGLFVLEQEEFYDEITYYVEVPVKHTVTTQKAKSPSAPSIVDSPVDLPEVETKESQKGGFFKFLKKKRSVAETPPEIREKEDQPKPDVKPGQDPNKPETRITYRREMRTKKIVRPGHYSYQKIAGADAKISQLIHWNGKLIASGLGGVYEISGKEAKRITSSPVRFLFASITKNKLIASTYDDRLLQFSFTESWNNEDPIENINEPVHYIFEDGESAIWFCGFDKVFRLTGEGPLQHVQRLGFPSSSFDKTIGLYLNNEVIIATSGGFYYFNKKTQQLERGDTDRNPIAYFANAGNLWFRDQHNWYMAGTSGGHSNLQLLNLFSSLRFIDTDPAHGALWVITGNNELLQFNSAQMRQSEVVYPLILKTIQHEDIITARNFLKVEQDESAFIIEVVKPDYIGNRFVEYRFKLEGLHQDWSEWSTQNNIIRFPYLPTGDYLLHVESRDIFGRINDMAPVRLSIAPPYWRQPWFYAAEFSVFVFLVLLSFRLSYRFLIVSRLLSLLSIIMFIEFIQTAAGESFSQSSPVIDFGIQVFVAMLILPVEGFLRRYFLQALAKRNELRLQKMVDEGVRIPAYEPDVPMRDIPVKETEEVKAEN
jgi:hypothetical protein